MPSCSNEKSDEVGCVGDDRYVSADPKNLSACDESPSKLAEEVGCVGDDRGVFEDPKNLSACDESPSQLAEEVGCVGDDRDVSVDPKNVSACDESPSKLAEEVGCAGDDRGVFEDPKNLSACDENPSKLAEEVGCVGDDRDVSADPKNVSACDESPSRLAEEDEGEDVEEEDEDVDFNPFLKEMLSPEASSSLSSEVDGLDGDAVESSLTGLHLLRIDSNRESEHGEEEVIMKTTVLTERVCEKACQKIVGAEQGTEVAQEKDNGSGSGTDFNDAIQGDPSIITDIPKSAIDLGTDDAICTRTRARYSLASFSLDELENFLQETDDEDDLQNVDDEEEYRKFLTFVLNGGNGDDPSTQDNEIVDDDEDNDADFEIELEEALESDDEITKDNNKTEYEKGGRRPQTRQIRRQKSNSQSNKKASVPTKRPLRPLLPVLPYGPVSPFSGQVGMLPEATPGSLSSSVQDGYASGFTPHQIGQLHCLIHEHVQLLIQVFCLCAQDHSRQHIVSQVQKLIFEIYNKRSEVQAWKNAPYPSTCFFPQYLYPSVAEDVPKFFPIPCTYDTNAMEEVYPPSNETATLQNIHLSEGMSERGPTGSYWAPYINGHVTTILDVAPLSLAGKFINDVNKAVQESRARNIESRCETRFEKEPLFPVSEIQLLTQAYSEVPSSSCHQPRKKTLAATLVENTKKQSIALVPREISKLAQIFFPFFNPAFYPHKPPPATASSRVLFTDSEDELLALGIWEYNTDWKAIQQRFLPCKSKHQIFVRQKNRCSSKAPENPIKAVKRMKNSPLTPEEIASIHEGIKYFKCNWSLVVQHIVPHRDPSLLPRQWRLALGTQKSYKLNTGAKEKRRLYEKRRKENHPGSSSIQNIEVERNHVGNINAEENAGKIYVHEAFLADWRPVDSNAHSFSAVHAHVGNSQQFMHQNPSFHFPGVRQPAEPNGSASKTTPNTQPKFYMPRYRAHKPYGKNMVKLAPDLPPVNLPPSVRIVSQSAFRGSQLGAPLPVPAVMQRSPMPKEILQIPRLTKASERRISDTHAEDSETSKENHVEGDERSNDSDLQMHPLLFQSLEDGHLPYYQLNSSASGSGSFSFFSGNQPQLNLTLLHTPHQENQVGLPGSSESTLLPKGIDFHPLFQTSDFTQLQYMPNTEPRYTAMNTRKANEPDLEFHLSSVSRKEWSLGGNDERAHKGAKSSSNVQDSGFTEDNQTSDSLFGRLSGDSLPNSSEFGSGDRSPVLPADDVHGYLDDIGDQSNPGIVMEQEELSDSDEENEENVEFECEEITDSEGDEGSGCEQITDMQIEEGPNLAPEKPTTESEPRTRTHSHGKPIDPVENRPSLELSLRSQGKGKGKDEDEAKNLSWLRLDYVSTIGKEDRDSTSDPDLGTKSLASSCPSRSCKKKSLNLNAVVEQRQTVNRSRQNGSAPPRKPRKRARRNDASLNIELSVQNRNCNAEDKIS